MRASLRSISFSLSLVLAASVTACTTDTDGASDDDAAASDEAALTGGQLDVSFRVSLDETFLGTIGTKLLFLGSDDGGTYVARRTVAPRERRTSPESSRLPRTHRGRRSPGFPPRRRWLTAASW